MSHDEWLGDRLLHSRSAVTRVSQSPMASGMVFGQIRSTAP